MDNVGSIITGKIIEALESGTIPWRRTWRSGTAKSLTSNREYRGINTVILGYSPYKSRYWVTFKQAKRLGGFIKKGEKSTTVVYWHWRTNEEMEALVDSGRSKNPAPCTPFLSGVFNLDQTEGIARPADDVPLNDCQKVEAAEKLVAGIPNRPEVMHGTELKPCYRPSLDRIELPHLSQFESAEHYYGCYLHEAMHSTAHPKRLNRLPEVGCDVLSRYSYEELIAELGASMLRGHCGLDSVDAIENSASYIEGWLKVLSSDRGMILKAASAAQRGVDYLRGVSFEEVAIKEAA